MSIVSNIEGVRDENSIVILKGIDVDTGEVVWFAVDARMAHQIDEIVAEGDDPEFDVEDWQVISRSEAVT